MGKTGSKRVVWELLNNFSIFWGMDLEGFIQYIIKIPRDPFLLA